MLRKVLVRIATATLLVASFASIAEAQTLDQTLSGCNGAAPLRTIQATPSNYRTLINGLIPGDRLLFAAGTYTQGLPIHGKNGQAGQCIVFEGPASGSPALFTGSDSWNVVSLKDSSYIAVRNLTLDGLDKAGDAVKAEATAVSVHHVLIEGLKISNFNPNYLRVGISTKCPAWNWVIRRNTIYATGTGMYLGNSDGTREFVNGLIEYNLVYDTMDYNLQVKHQTGRSTSLGMPASATTIIRYNVFSKQTGGTGPNLLVGHWPSSGPGSTDIYQIYGNLLYENSSPNESLFQGEGNIAFHDNLLVNRSYEGVRIQPHNGTVRRIEIFNNTVIAVGNGIRIAGGESGYTQRVVGNAVFAGTPLTGGQWSNNVTGSVAQASTYLNNPTANLGAGLDLYPKSGQLQGTAIDYTPFTAFLDYNRDFNGSSRINTYRGAYSGDGVNPGWTLALAQRPNVSAPPPSGCTALSDVEPNNSMTAPQAISGTCNQISGTFANDPTPLQEEYDYFRLNLPAGHAVTALLDNLTDNYDLEIYDAAGNWVGSSYNGGTTPEQASWTNSTASAMNVYVLVFRGPADARSTYQLKVTHASTAPPPCSSISDVEPNNSMTAPQAISGSCNQISGTFLNDTLTGQDEYFRVSLPAGATVTALLNGLSTDYDLEIYDAAGNFVGSSYSPGTTPDQASWTNSTASAMNVYIHVYRPAANARTTYQLRVSY
jgi:hypothetical protein